MEHAKLANGSRHESPSGHSPSPEPSTNRRTLCGRAVRRFERKLSREKPSLHDRSGIRSVLSRNQTSLLAAIVGATTWPRVSSSGEIADAANVSVGDMGRPHGRVGRRSRSSMATNREEGPALKGSVLIRFRDSSKRKGPDHDDDWSPSPSMHSTSRITCTWRMPPQNRKEHLGISELPRNRLLRAS